MDPILFTMRLLRILFYVLVVATLVLYLLARYQGWPDNYWIWCGMGTIGCSIIRFFLKMML